MPAKVLEQEKTPFVSIESQLQHLNLNRRQYLVIDSLPIKAQDFVLLRSRGFGFSSYYTRITLMPGHPGRTGCTCIVFTVAENKLSYRVIRTIA